MSAVHIQDDGTLIDAFEAERVEHLRVLEATVARAEKAEAEVARLRKVLAAARELVECYVCRCDDCWTSRGRHDPHGCTWEDAMDLREAMAEHDALATTSDLNRGTK